MINLKLKEETAAALAAVLLKADVLFGYELKDQVAELRPVIDEVSEQIFSELERVGYQQCSPNKISWKDVLPTVLNLIICAYATYRLFGIMETYGAVPFIEAAMYVIELFIAEFLSGFSMGYVDHETLYLGVVGLFFFNIALTTWVRIVGDVIYYVRRRYFS
jgi:nitrogenase molybdenum-iron protein alpha/beta subunit